jgi:hypothetical protein
VAASYYGGKEITPLTGGDIQTDKTRLGFDAQVYYEMPTIGGGSLRGEYYGGTNLNADSVKTLVAGFSSTTGVGTALKAGANPAHLATDFTGGYVMWVQNLGERLQLATRWDYFDPDTDVEHDQYSRIGLGLNAFYDGNTRVTVAYDIPDTDKLVNGRYEDPKDNLWTVQFQHRF